jgi:hypothetical protein
MITNDVLLDLLRRHVLWPGEQIKGVKDWPGEVGVAVTTSQRYFSVDVDHRMLLGQAPWVAGVVIATRGDLEYEGLPETDGVLVLGDGRSVSLTDPDAVAELGRRLESDLDPAAFAEVLVAWHPWTTAATSVLLERDQLRRQLDRPDLPTFEPPQLYPVDGGLVLTFFSSMLHVHDLGANTLLTVYEWTVLVPTGSPARWERRAVLDAVRARATPAGDQTSP